MGYAVYEISENRFGGYAVPAICDHPKCDKEIDRGISYVCGTEPFSEFGCGLYFCSEHFRYRKPHGAEEKIQLCPRCYYYRPPYKNIAPEHPEWIDHILTDDSWKLWRERNPKKVEKLIEMK